MDEYSGPRTPQPVAVQFPEIDSMECAVQSPVGLPGTRQRGRPAAAERVSENFNDTRPSAGGSDLGAFETVVGGVEENSEDEMEPTRRPDLSRPAGPIVSRQQRNEPH